MRAESNTLQREKDIASSGDSGQMSNDYAGVVGKDTPLVRSKSPT